MKIGPQPHAEHDLLLDAIRRGAKVRWDDYEPSGAIRLPGSGEVLVVHPWEVEYAYRELISGRTHA